MSLNYGLSSGSSGPKLTPTKNGVCIFDYISTVVGGEYPNPPNHPVIYILISEIGAESVIHIVGHNFPIDVPNNDDSIIEYYIRAYSKTSVSSDDFKLTEHKPIINTGTYYGCNVDKKVRVGDCISQSKLDEYSSFRFAIGRKTAPSGGTIGGSPNMMFYTIYKYI